MFTLTVRDNSGSDTPIIEITLVDDVNTNTAAEILHWLTSGQLDGMLVQELNFAGIRHNKLKDSNTVLQNWSKLRNMDKPLVRPGRVLSPYLENQG